MGEFWQRLKQRKMMQWAVAYLAGAWVVLQVLDVLAKPFGFPDLVLRSATVLLVAGAFATLVLAWYHGEKGKQRVSGAELVLIAAVLLVTGAVLATVSPEDAAHDLAAAPAAAARDDSERLPLLIMMDSPHPARVYDPETAAANATNADVVSDILLDLPVRRQKETVGPYWHREEEIRRFDPDLIVIHFSAFCGEQCEDRSRLRQLVQYLADTDTRFLIYGRWVEEELRVAVHELLEPLEEEWPGILERVEVFGLADYGPLRWRDPATAGQLKLRVKRILGLS